MTIDYSLVARGSDSVGVGTGAGWLASCLTMPMPMPMRRYIHMIVSQLVASEQGTPWSMSDTVHGMYHYSIIILWNGSPSICRFTHPPCMMAIMVMDRRVRMCLSVVKSVDERACQKWKVSEVNCQQDWNDLWFVIEYICSCCHTRICDWILSNIVDTAAAVTRTSATSNEREQELSISKSNTFPPFLATGT